jgi:hypothetical protein
MKPFAHGGVGQRGWGLGRQLVALRRQHGQRGATETRMVLKMERKSPISDLQRKTPVNKMFREIQPFLRSCNDLLGVSALQPFRKRAFTTFFD